MKDETVEAMATGKESLTVRLRKACLGNPAAKIPWPHRILHEAADELSAANARTSELEALNRELADRLNGEVDCLGDGMKAALLVYLDTDEQKALRADAERWRYWLREHGWSGYFDDGLTNSEFDDDIIAACDKERGA